MQDAGYLAWTGEAVHLTARGREEASRIIRAHRLWERHLADDTGFSEAEWHEIADLEEHRLTPDAAEALARSLGQPARDPHGDPIPTADGALVAHEGQRLSAQAAGTTLRVTHVEDEPAEVYRQIAAAGLAPGVVLRLLEVTPQAVRLQANGDELRLLTTVADNIAVLAVAPEDAQQAPSGQPLYVLRAGQRGRVIGLTPRCRGAERRRMLDLGVLPGTMIEAVMISPGGDPTAYRIRDALIALRREQADLIRVTPLTGSEP
jgi:DtxR family Mn-dependent transcriptional regulator